MKSLLALFLLALPCHGATASARVGQSATLTVTSNGTAPFTYQWSRNGTAIDGATLASYAIASVVLTDAGTYTVTVANSAGSTVSDNAILTITPMLATLSVSETHVNYPAPAIYQWRLNGQSVPGASQPTWTFDPASTVGSISLTITYPNFSLLK